MRTHFAAVSLGCGKTILSSRPNWNDKFYFSLGPNRQMNFGVTHTHILELMHLGIEDASEVNQEVSTYSATSMDTNAVVLYMMCASASIHRASFIPHQISASAEQVPAGSCK